MDDRAIIDDLRRQLTEERRSKEHARSLFRYMEQSYCELELIRDAQGRAVDHRCIAFNPAF